MTESTFFDQSFSVTKTNVASGLKHLEGLMAKFGCSIAESRGELILLGKAENSDSSADRTSFFPHGQVDYAAGTFDKSAKSLLTADNVSPRYPARFNVGDDIFVVEASEDIILTAKDSSTRGRYKVSQHAHLIVFGDVVCIEGTIRTYGTHICIFARELRTQSTNDQTAELNTTPREPATFPIPEYQSVADSGAKGKAAAHHKRWRDGWNAGPVTAIDGDPHDEPAGRGENGKPGQNGERGKAGEAGGDIFIFCHSCTVSRLLA